jgi:polysaccharide export outer membrane protein
MQHARFFGRWTARVRTLIAVLIVALLGFPAATETAEAAAAPPAPNAAPSQIGSNYVIGAGDSLQVFVWKNPELSTTVPVRPDGRISIPLVEDIECAGKTPTQLARDIEDRLKKYVVDPTVTVIVNQFVGPYTQQIRIVGEALQPRALPYRANMSVLDAMIAAGGLTPYASGNRATLVRTVNGQQTSSRVRLDDLLKDGDVSANVPLQPGDIIIIPQSFF